LGEHIRYNHKVTHAEWSEDQGRWSLRCDNGASIQCRFLFGCTGYYCHDTGHVVEFEDAAKFGGQIVHPQDWGKTDDLSYAGKRVVIIGSGATAVTMLPAVAEEAKHVTMLQRSPTYIMTRENIDPVAKTLLEEYPLPEAHSRIRQHQMEGSAERREKMAAVPQELLRKLYVAEMRKSLPAEYMSDEDFAKHFTPRYYPWEQRVCFCPDSDFYECLKDGRASIVTDRVARFDEHGIVLSSGERLDADLIVTATGLQLQHNSPMASMAVSVDGVPYVAAEHVSLT
jgi:monooxygenase